MRPRSPPDAIVILGCRLLPGNSPSAVLTRRLDRGVELFHNGAAPLLVLSGGGAGPVPEAEIMRRMAIARGVPPTALLVEPRSGNTVENARETARLLRSHSLRSVLLVSDRVHLPRAATVFRLAGLRVAGCAASPPFSAWFEARAVVHELAAFPRSLVRMLLQR